MKLKEVSVALKKNETEHKQFAEAIGQLHIAMFGDGNGDLGMKAKVDAMYEFFNGASIIGRLVKWSILTLGSLAAAWYALARLFSGKPLF